MALRRNRRLHGERRCDGGEPGIDRVEGSCGMDLTAGSYESGVVCLDGEELSPLRSVGFEVKPSAR